VQLTRRDREILDALTKRIRVFSLHQIARTWWADCSDPERVADNRLRQLAADDLLEIRRAPAHPELPLEEPVVTWALGEGTPDFGSVSYKLQARWSAHPILTPCVSATKKATRLFGGHGGRGPRDVERTHDIHMARVFLLYRIRRPEVLPGWVFEEQIKAERKLERRRAEYGEKLPDVVLREGSSSRVVEFGGAYNKDKLTAFHGYCKEYSFPYEIW
jgi:hypothetical protein